MNNRFKNKKTGREVRYEFPVKLVEDVGGDKPTSAYLEQIGDCIMVWDDIAKQHVVVNLLEFMNTYEPSTKPTDDAILTLEKLINIDNEEHTENIRTLHSGSTDSDSGSNTEVLEDSK